jgi:dynein heavy chain
MHERKQLEEQKAALVSKIAGAQRTLSELEEKILLLLSSSTGSLLDDEVLVTALETAKTTSEDMKQQLAVSEKTEAKIDVARQAFLPCAVRAAVLFFVLKDLAAVDQMYQFSLDSYLTLFSRSLASSPESEDLVERIRALNEYHTLNVYRTTCRALFEQHKLLFAFQLCVKVLDSEKKLNRDEYQFLLRGGAGSAGASKDSQLPNPCPDWLPDPIWEHLVVLDRLHGFKNFASSFEQNSRDWREWFLKPEPESVPLPGEWENRSNELQHLLLVRCFRPDRLGSAVSSFISSNLGAKFVEPPPFDPRQAFEDSAPLTPLLFVLSPGVDPLSTVSGLATARGLGPDRFVYHPLG